MRYLRDSTFWERVRERARDPNGYTVSRLKWAQLKGYVAGGLLLGLFKILREVTASSAIVDRMGRIGALAAYVLLCAGILFALWIWLSRREMRITQWPTIWPVVWVVVAGGLAAIWLFVDPHR
jgi:hypothetical protein